MTDTYSPNITIKKIFKIFWNRILFLISTSFLGLVIGLSVALITIKPSYLSNGSISSTKSIGPSLQQTICDVARSGEIALKTSESLAEQHYCHSSGEAITSADIQNGVKATFSASTYIISISFESSDQSICKPVLDALLTITVDYCSGPDTKYNDLKNALFVSDSASSAKKVSSNMPLYIAAGFFAGLAMSAVFFLIYDLRRDKIEALEDLSSLGCTAQIFSNNKKRIIAKKIDQNIEKDSVNNAINSLEVYSSQNDKKVFAVFSLKKKNAMLLFLNKICESYSQNNKKIAILDFDIHSQSPFKSDNSIPLNDAYSIDKKNSSLHIIYRSKPNSDQCAAIYKDYQELQPYLNQYDKIFILFPPFLLFQDLIVLKKQMHNFVCVCEKNKDSREDMYTTIMALNKQDVDINLCFIVDYLNERKTSK